MTKLTQTNFGDGMFEYIKIQTEFTLFIYPILINENYKLLHK